MVKERVSVSAFQLNVLVETGNDEEMRLESILELADGITQALVTYNEPFTVYYFSVKEGMLKACYIGDEIERKQWFEMLMYDQSDSGFGMVEEYFLKEHPGISTYLYIGFNPGLEGGQDAVWGNQQTMAVPIDFYIITKYLIRIQLFLVYVGKV